MRRFTLTLAILFGGLAVAGAQTLSLEDCKSFARENDLAMKNARLDLSSAKAQRSEARLEYFPTLSAHSLSFHALNPLVNIGLSDVLGTSDAAWELKNNIEDYGSQAGINTSYKAMQYGYGVSLMAVQPLFAGGRIVNGNRLAGLGVKAAELQLEVKERESEASIEEKYWLVVSLEEKKRTLEQASELLDTLYRDACAALGSGILTNSEKLQVEQKRSELAATRSKLRGGVRLAKMDLLNAIGYKYEILALDSIVLGDSLEPQGAPEQYLVPEEELAARMSEKELLNLQVEAKELEKKMMVGATLPEVGLGATYGYGSLLGSPSSNGGVFLSVKVPLSDWGKTAHKITRYENEVRKARNERDYYSDQLVLKARQLRLSLEVSWEELQAAHSSCDAARDNYSKTASMHKAGMVTVSDLLEARLNLQGAEDALVDARIAYRKAIDEYLRY